MWRTLRYFAATRVLIASALLLMLAAIEPRAAPASEQGPLVLVGIYLGVAVVFALLAANLPKRFLAQALGGLVLDMVMISALMVSSGGLVGGYSILYLLPLAGASLLLPRVLVYFFCSVAVLVILFDAALRVLRSPVGESLLYQAGVFGAMLFGVTGLLQWLSSRLAGQEQLVQTRDRDLRGQLAINRLVIAQLDQGVVVVDGEARVKANNLAARRLLGLADTAQFTGRSLADESGAAPLATAFRRWRAGHSGGMSLVIERPPAAPGACAPGRLRARFVQPAAVESDEFLIFLQDLREVEDRAQQLKLAAMGRLTASIAHEIRNPLAAISQAGQMLGEDSTDPVQRRLAQIVRENTVRLNTLVEDVLRVARREPPAADQFDLGQFVSEWLTDYLAGNPAAAGRVQLTVAEPLAVKFEPSHLRQVLYNLIDNALRYASAAPGAVVVRIERGVGGGAELWVQDDGPGVSAEVRAALFEPFYTTRAEGTGLGLFLAREFCDTNGAKLVFRARAAADAGAPAEGFVVEFSSDRLARLEADTLQSE